MSTQVVLDSGVLGMVVHPSHDGENGICQRWLRDLLTSGGDVYIPEIADYELRRKLIHIRSGEAIAHLDALEAELFYLQIDTASMRLASELWAEARRGGYSTAPDYDLDGDVILAAQAQLLGNPEVVIATNNVRHLSRYTNATRWADIRTD